MYLILLNMYLKLGILFTISKSVLLFISSIALSNSLNSVIVDFFYLNSFIVN